MQALHSRSVVGRLLWALCTSSACCGAPRMGARIGVPQSFAFYLLGAEDTVELSSNVATIPRLLPCLQGRHQPLAAGACGAR